MSWIATGCSTRGSSPITRWASRRSGAIHVCTPHWAETITGVAPGVVERAAHLYGGGPSLLWIGQGLQRQPTGGNVVRAVGLLPALTGHLGRPGGGFLYLNGIATRGLDGDYLSRRAPAAGGRPHREPHGPDRGPGGSEPLPSAVLLEHQHRRLQPRAAAASGGRWPEEDLFTVAVDLFPTDTVDYADIVLPAASFLEHDDLVVSYFHQSISAQARAVDPPGEALPNSEIFRRLATAMGYQEPALQESDEHILRSLMISRAPASTSRS